MLQIESIILYSIKQINKERTIYSLYHLLNGKKSSQTIQDAHLFSLKHYFGIYEQLSRESFESIIHSMAGKRLINNIGEQRFNITPLGKELLEKGPLPRYINGWNFHQITSLFWERLSLLVQVVSNLMFGETRYIPIQKNKEVHNWLKSTLKEIALPRLEMGNTVYFELNNCFDVGKEVDPSLVVFRLTGFQQIGLTPLQVAKQLNLDYHDYQIGFTNTLHYLIQKIKDEGNQLKILPFLINDLMQDDELTLTSRKTQRLLNQGYTLDMIANIRHLKLSTIEDHLVELALNIEGFSIEPYVDRELQNKILEISRQTATKQLKLIREKIGTATYFQIRLVLAKYGDR
ncbi:helix-turn-helix domain-containing protein [Bacillus sp. sid0103]|uniref:helix-turn-helix domain-containing protein n=1 Tax=Bacillus sp. sid0103 TaxID=2856337 RepID=UPI001C45B302|nr:helix-turn-helix domain-containing protein [Bacillus sp. sid0103]MBV7507172.1 helix-turn-helix domain-containing protein [Bacillus sp. sid0103]